MSKHTPGPWEAGEYDDCLGYDCMTGGVRAGPVILDAADYGQTRHADITNEQMVRLMADARLITAAPELLEMLIQCRKEFAGLPHSLGYDFTHLPKLDALIAKATGDA